VSRRVLTVAVVLLVLAAPLVLPDFYVTLLNYIGLSSIVALGLVLLTGVGGQTSFGQAAFVGIGAYTTALLATRYGISPWLTLPAGIALTIVVALGLGIITMRLSGHYLPLATIAWGIAIYYLLGNMELLGKYSGIAEIPPLTLFGVAFGDGRTFYYLIWGLVLLALFAVRNLLDSRCGRAIRTLKGRTTMAECFGVNTARLKIVIFVYAAVLAALSGWLYAHFLRFVSPQPFGVNASIDYLFMAVIGGSTEVWGAVIGAALLTFLRQWLQDLLPKLMYQSGNFEIIVFGLLVIVMLHRARDGLVPYFAGLVPAGPKRMLPAACQPPPGRAQPRQGELLLELQGVSKRFGALAAVKDLSFEMRAGEILGLIGPNGAGKSTVFNLLTGVLAIDEGAIVFRGERIEHLAARDIASRGIARTFQHVNLLASRTALENVAIGAHLRGSEGVLSASLRLDRAEDARLRHEAARRLEDVGLGSHMFDAASTLPLGSQRLLEVARALCADPVLLLLDEPAAGLRHLEKRALADLIRSLRASGLSILVVEHDMDFIMGLVDRVVVMNFGERLAQARDSDPFRRARSLSWERGMSGLKVRGLCAGYGKVEVLHGLDLEVGSGAIVTVIGPNGAGKTTLLAALMGLIPARGSVHHDDDDLSEVAVEARVPRLCLVPERRELFGELSVADNLLLGAFARIRRGARDVQRDTAAVYARFPQLSERRSQLAATLSGGERQMLALGRALMARPLLLMLDEPSLGLAPKVVRDIFHVIAELKSTGVSILLVEQNARAALQIADYAYVLEMGKLVAQGPASELAASPRVVETYLGLPAGTL
jgi:ABC-type branched-subunit amino acid transport system ATPase component/ABC-type branched-subunit amino acid transport system permease subunit